MERVRAKRTLTPAYQAQITETVDAPGEARALSEGDLSWGDRDGIRTYSIIYRNGKFKYQTDSYYGTETNHLPALSKEWILSKGEVQTYEARLETGEVTQPTTVDLLPPSWNYWIDGEPIDQFLSRLSEPELQVTETQTLVKGVINGVTYELTFDVNHDWGLSKLVMNDGAIVQEVVDWTSLAGHYFPKQILFTAHLHGNDLVRRTYDVTSLEPLSEDVKLTISWPNGTRVYNRINDSILKVVDGQLVGDPVFDKRTKSDRSSNAFIFMAGGFIAFLSATVLAIRLMRRRTVA